MEKIATRISYGNALNELVKIRPDLFVLDADVSCATMTNIFQKANPERHFNCGIQECNMLGVAAGIASTGNLVFASAFAMFAAGRAYEIARNSIGYPKLNVKIGATHAGISVGEDGASHQCCEDIALMRTIPGMTIINPADDIEAKAAVLAMADYEGPAYLRFGRLPVLVFNNPDTYKFEVGKGITLRDGGDITIIATGLLVYPAIEAAEELAKDGINARVINIHTIKPLDEELVLKAACETGAIVVAEEHSVIGGLGSAVAELTAEKHLAHVVKLGINDTYGYSGPAVQLLEEFGLTAGGIIEKVKFVLNK
ncbi:MAG: transketolase family protein [Oscillospiraceae bacterium]|jgi:transketolase|nr:transketolase family protein [Oscillospiraceae bacterium]